MTLRGVCKDRQAKSACEAVITREELDRFSTSGTDGSSAARGRQAVQYARTLAYSALAEQQGLDKNPVFARELEAQLKLMRARILANAFLQSLQNQAQGVTEAEIQKYYDSHRDQYEQVQVRRLSVPLAVPTESGHHLERTAVKVEVEELRKRAIAGEDFNKLQQEGYKHLNILAAPPQIVVSTMRRASVQGDEAKLFELNSGDISAVLDLPAAIAIIKIESKEPMPIESARPEIASVLRQAQLQNQLTKLTEKISAQFNLQYLEMPAQPDLFGPNAVNPAINLGGMRRPTGGR